MRAIDLIDARGDIRAHILRYEGRTLCGRQVATSQAAAGNRPCKTCIRLAVGLRIPSKEGWTCPMCGNVEESPEGRACSSCNYRGDWIQPVPTSCRHGKWRHDQVACFDCAMFGKRNKENR